MAQYKCFQCEKSLSSKVLDKRFVCPHCGSRVFYKPRNKVAKMKAV
ncbi:transposase [Candidatus Pacearchaeota archaeon]|nr:transposase [Candidatus Pacearchaeota archaeon]